MFRLTKFEVSECNISESDVTLGILDLGLYQSNACVDLEPKGHRNEIGWQEGPQGTVFSKKVF